MDITNHVENLVAFHGSESIWTIQETDRVAAILAQSFSDMYKDRNGIRPRFEITVSEVVENLANWSDTSEDNTPIEGVSFEGEPIIPDQW